MATSPTKVEPSVELGFLEESEIWKLSSKYFPSKVGGWPSWLNLKELPSSEQLKCKNCGHPCIFILQVYSPNDDPETFHRTIFVFACRNGQCYTENCNQNFIVLRNQLPRKNEFYSFDPPIEREKDAFIPSAEDWVKLCCDCGSKGSKHCGECKISYYCSKEHQVWDWKMRHKTTCKNVKEKESDVPFSIYGTSCKMMFPEFELETEPEVIKEKKEKSEGEKLKEYQEFVKSSKELSQSDKQFEEKDFDSFVAKEDKYLSKFRKRIANEPTQVLRYHLKGEPLWISSKNVPNEDIPACNCGAPRVFEFQIMPQLLNHLQVDSLSSSIDWGVLAIYTCSKNCNSGEAYKEEFIWKQDFEKDDV